MKKVLFYFLFWYSAVEAVAQTPELIFDEAAYEKVPKLADFEFFGSKYGEIPLEYSLKKYCPEPNFQNKIHNCVFQSLSYAAMTILYAAQNNITDKAEINNLKFSALFGFNQLTTHCMGISFVPALEFLKNKGTLLFADFDKPNQTDCRKKATPEQYQKAAAYKIKNYVRVFDNKDDVYKKIRIIKKSIATNTPIIAAMKFPESIITYSGKPEYYADAQQIERAHSMVVIGYDEYSFELINSWGTHWGNEGYVKIKYNDFFRYLTEGYQIAFEKRIETERVPLLKGTFEFKTPREGTMQLMPFVLKEGKYYQAVEKSAVAQQFQLAAVNLQKNKYVYVFSYDPDGKTNLHWPKVGGNYVETDLRESPLTPYETTSFLMPGPKRAFTKDKAGTDFLFVLYSDKELDIKDLEKRLKNMETVSSQSVLSKFESAFQGLLLDWKKIKYNSEKVSFTAPATEAIVPLILQLEGV